MHKMLSLSAESEKAIKHEVLVFAGASVLCVCIVAVLSYLNFNLPFLHLVIVCLVFGFSTSYDRKNYPMVAEVSTQEYWVRLATNVALFVFAFIVTKIITWSLIPTALPAPFSYIIMIMGVGSLFSLLRSANFMFILASRI